MNLIDIPRMLRRKARAVGFQEALRLGLLRLLEAPSLPLTRVSKDGLFANDVEGAHERKRMAIRTTSLMCDASNVEETYPQVFESDGKVMRYTYLEATGESRGLVVQFHGHNAFLHLGPVRPLRDFDLLAPWDTFGWRRQGSWFWGEKGTAITEVLVQSLIEMYREEKTRPWFCMGGSMGGFGALYHGIKNLCDGLYVTFPQVDLALKIEEYGGRLDENPYAYLRGQPGDPFPDLLALATQCDDLPPLFLVQNQYDQVNTFAEHAFRLIEIYNGKRGWYGLRVHPSVGHWGDGDQAEAELFFSLVLEHDRPRVAPLSSGR